MRASFSIAFLLFCLTGLNAQNNSNVDISKKFRHHEIALNAFTNAQLTQYTFPYLNDDIGEVSRNKEIALGMTYKYHIRKNSAIRVGFNYSEFAYQVVYNFADYSGIKKGNAQIFEFGGGFEYQVNIWIFHPYIAGDLFYNHNVSKGYEHTFNFGHPVKGNFQHLGNVLGIAPAVGLRIQPIEALSFSAEMSLPSISINQYDNQRYISQTSGTVDQLPFDRIYLRLISVNFHF